ncbi:apolipoprotein N-acyltransferase [Helicobacter sp. 23-1046]
MKFLQSSRFITSITSKASILRTQTHIPSFEDGIESCLKRIFKKELNPKAFSYKLCIIVIDAFLAFLFSAPIYVLTLCNVAFNADTPLILGSFLALLSIYVYLRIPKERRFGFGFFVGVFWFYWASLSFRFVDLEMLIPFIIGAIALIYGGIFWLLLFCECLVIRLLGLLVMHFITPFGFDWLVPEAVLAYSYFDVSYLHFALVVCGLYCFLTPHKWRFKNLAGIFFLILALDFGLIASDSKETQSHTNTQMLQRIYLSHTNVPQHLKWEDEQIATSIQENFALIQNAIAEGKQVIVLPEIAFPMVLESGGEFGEFVISRLKQYAKDITIIAGALRVDKGEYYNSTFVFNGDEVFFIDKVILAPFGENIPLPDFLVRSFGVLQMFQFASGKEFGDIGIFGMRFRNAICYEATSRKLYADYPQFVIAMSNNAWFYPSIEPFLQKMLLKFYARKYQTTILHSGNMSQSYIITP